MDDAAASVLDVRVLGPLEARRGGETVRLGAAKPRMLFADLVLHAGEVLSVDRLVDDVWGEHPPDTASHAVEVYVSQLRKALGPVVVWRPPGYVAELDPEHVDERRFARLAVEGRELFERDPEHAAVVLREALALWRGPALADFAFEPFAQVDIARLEELRHGCLEDRIEADLALGRHTDLVAELEALVRAEPLRERLRSQLMRALYAAGRQADALAAYRDARELLVEELGVEPGPELRALEAAILRQDDELLAPAPPAVVPAAAGTRKLAAVLAAAIDSPDDRDPEALHALLDRWGDLVETVVARHGGTVASSSGDTAVAVFGAPAAHEDDALRAGRAALELAAGTAALGLALRAGLELGEVFAGSRGLVTGAPLAAAREASAAAAVGEVLLGAAAAVALAHAARIEDERRLVEVADAPAFERRLDARLVGRDEELGALRAALDEAIAAASARSVEVIGAPGIGKTRLARELVASACERVLVVAGACIPEGEGSTYRPLLAIVTAAAGATTRDAVFTRVQDERAAAVLASALGAEEGTPSAPEIAWAFRRFCEALAREQPLLLVLDDLHWAQPTLLELVEHLATRATGSILVLCIAREDLLEEHPSFLPDAQRVVLDALSPAETETLVDDLVAGRLLPEELRVRVVEAAEGNPLFLEQLLAFVAEEGIFAERPLPPTIRALLAARLDRLGPGERGVLARAAVVGREFRLAELEALLEPEAAATADRHLRSLATRGFVRARDGAYRFHHALVQEAVTRTTPKEQRAELHERLADWLAAEDEADELVGFHLERCYRLRVELGAEDRRVRQLAADAGSRLGGAGIRAWKRNDVPATVNLLERATELLPADGTDRLELLCELGIAYRAGGQAERATRTLKTAAEGGDRRIRLRAEVELTALSLLDAPGADADAFLALVDSARSTYEGLGDDRALGRLWLLAGFVHGGLQLRCAEWEKAAARALAYYRRAGWPPATCLGQVANALYHGPAPVDEAIHRCVGLLGEPHGGAAGEANVLVFVAGLEAMRGRFSEARRLASEARHLYEELGQHASVAAYVAAIEGRIELAAGDVMAAERVLRESCEFLEGTGAQSTLATRAGELAEVLLVQDRLDEGWDWAASAERSSFPDDRHALLSWQPVQARLLARRGELEHAEQVAECAVRLAESTDALNHRGRVQEALADVVALRGRRDEAAAWAARAGAMYEQKGNVVAAAAARRARSLGLVG